MTTGKRRMRWCALMALTAAMYSPLAAEPSDALLARMDSDEFQVRSKAYADLRQWAQQNIGSSPELLHKAWKASGQPEVKSRCYELMKDMVIQRKFGKGSGFIGIRMQQTVVRDAEGKPPRAGVMITSVQPNTPGAKAGLKMNDVILGVDKFEFGKARIQPAQGAFQMDFETVTRFGDYIKSKQPGETVTLHIVRNAKKMDVKVTLMKRPASADVDAFGRRPFDQDDEKKQFFGTWLKSMVGK